MKPGRTATRRPVSSIPPEAVRLLWAADLSMVQGSKQVSCDLVQRALSIIQGSPMAGCEDEVIAADPVLSNIVAFRQRRGPAVGHLKQADQVCAG